MPGARRQRIEYLLPLAADGEAGGVRQEFKVARNLVEATLVQLKDMPAFKVCSLQTLSAAPSPV